MLISIDEHEPSISPTAWVAGNATIAGSVTLAEHASVWYSAVLRADGDRISVGPASNIQDGCVLHTDPGLPLRVGGRVSIGHRAILHGCTIEDDVLIGMGAIVMNGARIGAGSLVGAGALVPEGSVVPQGSLVVGAPSKVLRQLTIRETEAIRANADHYVEASRRHARAHVGKGG